MDKPQKSKRFKINYVVGSWFAIPLQDGGFATGVIARMAPRGKIILAYLFGPRRETVPTISDMVSFQPKNALRSVRIGDLGLVNGDWPIIGRLPEWRPEQWPIPMFFGQDELTGRVWRSIYPDSDPSQLPRREPATPADIVGLEEDGLYGSGLIETLMTRALAKR